MIALRTLVILSATSLAAICSSDRAHADDPGNEFFEKKIRPLLVAHCFECHATDSKKLGGGLLLDSRDGVRKGGDSGTSIVAGKPDESLLIKAIRYTDESVKMPPKGKLPVAAIADLEEWIKRGAPDPREKPASKKIAESWADTMRQRAKWWSLQPVQNPEVPRPRQADWSDQPIDRFVLSRLERQGLSPADAADARTLTRRMSLVLTGLPPTSEQLAMFLRDCGSAGASPSRAAIEKLVDSLLNSPHFGERWARHWMDVVRFTETHGNEWNYEVHHAWRYRDYLIRAFNDDVPFDQFICEHIAGDLLPSPASAFGPRPGRFAARWRPTEGFNESVIGTGFYRFGEVNHDDCISLTSLGYDIIDNQIDTLTKAFQATTVACARCHNHKLDAISMEDYYALLGVLRSSRLVSHCIDASDVNETLKQRLRELKGEIRNELAVVWLRETQQIARYMQAAQAKRQKRADADELSKGLDPQRLEKWIATLAAEKQPFDDPFEPWRRLVGWPPSADQKRSAEGGQATDFISAWKQLSEQFAKEDRERSEFNRTQFVTFRDSRPIATASSTVADATVELPVAVDWQIGGQGLQDGPSPSGNFAIHTDGESLVRAILPAGRFTHLLSDKLNGTLRSPVLPLGKKHISFQVVGQRSSAVRLVSNNCQLNYKNYRALTSADWQWVTFSPPDDRDQLRTYAELMTMFDNPKFPDQLSALGGDKDNYRLPWEKAAENPRSYFGITRVVLHDTPEPPRPEVTHLRPLFAGNEPTSFADFSNRTAAIIEAAIKRWAENDATDDDARWLDMLLQRELLSNKLSQSPQCEELAKQYRAVEARLQLPRVIAGISDGGPGFEQPVFVRGDCAKPGNTVPRRYVEVLSKSRDSFRSPGSGRLELAELIASADNPLTARVIVNRTWHHLFGTGLVRTVDDFGHVGELPSHPELLDYLAEQFVEEGWSIKKLIRSLVLTRTFQLSNQPSPASREVDPQNRLLQHYPARRLEAEAIRDSMLAASGRLDRTLFGPSVQPFRDKDYADRRLFAGPLDGHGRRSIYIKSNLMEGPKFLEAFNFPGGKVTQGRRDVTNVPAQALALLNDPFVLQQADVWAQQLVARSDDSIGARIDVLFQTALNRSPIDVERQRFERTALELAELHQIPPSNVLTSQLVWRDLAHAIFNLKEFIYIP